ncbi:hypothetical protein L3X38_041729 [Prunus dulcis]|uniref:Uncharacterized protein n=1 Tax=Prunus dulcis TaxID=3755 RepID=A0AAD4UV93_PRUDU|nr:hypothetical protein L3X38_041729 [Prunus dulcis]
MNRDCEEDDESKRMKNALILGTMAKFQSSSSSSVTKPDSQNGPKMISACSDNYRCSMNSRQVEHLKVVYNVNGHDYNMGYYLVDDNIQSGVLL